MRPAFTTQRNGQTTATSKAGLLHTQKPQLPPALLDDCRREHGPEAVALALEELKSAVDVRSPIAWFREACANIACRMRISKFEAEHEAQKKDRLPEIPDVRYRDHFQERINFLKWQRDMAKNAGN